METGVVIIQEPGFRKTSVEEASAGVVLDHSTMDVDKVNLSTVLDSSTIQGEPEVAEVVKGSGNKETEESKHKKEEVMKTISVVEDSKIVKEQASETETDGQGTVFVDQPDSFNKNTDDAKIIDEGALEKEKEDDTTQKPEEVSVEKLVIEEGQTETKNSQEREADISKASEAMPIKTDEVKEEKDSRTTETSVNGTEAVHNETSSVEENSRNGENVVQETTTNGESLEDVETTKRVLIEAEKDAGPRLHTNEKDEIGTVKTVDAEQVSPEISGDNKKEEVIIHKAEEVQESPTVTETPTIRGEDIELKASKDTEEHEHVLVRDIPQEETLVPKAEIVDTSTVQESGEPILDLNEEEETVTLSDEVIEPPEQRFKDTEEDEHVLGRKMRQGEIFVTEAKSLVTKEDTEPIMDLKEDKEQEEITEEVSSNLALRVDKEDLMDEKIKQYQAVGAQTMERGLQLNESEAELVDRNITDKTIEKLVAHPDVESVEQMEKPPLESPSEVSEETSKTLDVKIEEEEEVPQHQEGQEEGYYGSETKEERVSLQESSGIREKVQEERCLGLTSLQEESCLPMEKDEEEEKIQKHEQANKEVKSDDEVIQVSSASPSEEWEGETAKKIEEIKVNEEEQVADNIQRILETVGTEPAKSIEDDIPESLNSAGEDSKDVENVQIVETDDEKASRTAETSVNGTEDEHNATVSVEGISENIVHKTAPEEIINSKEISHEVTGDREKEEDIIHKSDEVQESPAVIKTQIIQEENIELKASKDTEEHEHVLVKEIDNLLTEAEDVNTSTVQKFEAATSKTLEITTGNETEVDQETKKDVEPSLDLKEDKQKEETETLISSDEVRPSDQVDDVQPEEFVEAESKETLQEESTEKKHENPPDAPSGDSENFQTEAVLVAKRESISSELELKDGSTEVDKVDRSQVMVEQRNLEPHEPEAEQIHQNKTDKAEATSSEKLLVESVDKMQSSSLECPSEVSDETITTAEEKIKEKLQEEEEEVTLKQQSSSYGLEIKEEILSVPESKDHEEVSYLQKETSLHHEQIEKYEPTNEVPNDQQSFVEEKSDQVSSPSPSEEQEGGIVVDAIKLEDIKANEEEQIQTILEPLEIAEPQSLLPSYSEEQQQNPVSEKIEGKEEKPIVQILSEKAKKGHEETTMRDIPHGATTVTEAVDTSRVQEVAVLNTLETNINESEEVHSPKCGEEEGKVTKEDTEPRLDLKEDKKQEEAETVILADEVIKDESQGREESVEVKPKEMVQQESTQGKDENLLDVPSGESGEEVQSPSLDDVDEKIEEKTEEVTLYQENQETKEEIVSVAENSELGVQAKEEESCPPNEQEKETPLEKEQIKKHESTSEKDSSAHQTTVEEKSDEVIQTSSAPLSEEREADETIEDLKENEEEQVADKIQKSLETVEPHSPFPSPTEECDTKADAEKIDKKVKETEPMGDGTGSSKSLEEFEEEKLKRHKETFEVDESKAEELPSSETVPQETLSDVMAVQLKRDYNATESHEGQEEETTVVQEEQKRDIGTSLTDKCSMDQTQPEEQVNEESPRDRDEKDTVISTEKGETKTRELEEENMAEHVDSSEKYGNETEKEDEDKTVGLDGLGTSRTSENECTMQKEFENVEAPKLEESKEDKRQEVSEIIEATESKGDQTPSFISELEDQTPKQSEEIHEEEIKEARVVVDQSLEKSQDDQSPSLVSEQVEEIHEEEEEETKEPKKVEAPSGPVEVSHAHQIPSSELVSRLDDLTLKQVHEEETKANKLQEEEILPAESVPTESFSASMLASGEDGQVTVEEGYREGEKQEERHVSVEKEESVAETKPIELEVERTEQSDDQIETSTEVTKVEDEDTKNTDTKVGEVVKGQSSSHAPEEEQEEFKDLGTLQPAGATIQDQGSLKNDDCTFSTETGDAKHGDENSSTLPVVGILKELQTTLEENERETESGGNELHSISAEPETLEKNLVVEESTDSETVEASMLQQHEGGELKLQEDVKVEDSIPREYELNVAEKLKEETREIADCKEETPADLSLKEVIPASALPFEESKQEESKKQEDVKAETHEADQTVEIKEESQDKMLSGLSDKRDTEEASELGVGHDSATPQVEKEEESHNVLGNDQEINEVVTSGKKIVVPLSVAEKELTEGLSQAISDDTKSSNEMDLPSEQIPKDQREEVEETSFEVNKVQEDKNEETVDALVTSQKFQVQDRSTDKQSSDLKEDLDDETKDEGHDTVVAQNKDSESIEETKEVDYVKTEREDAIKHGVSIEEKNNISEQIGQEATKEIYQEEFKQTDTLTAIKEEIKEEEKETPEDCLNSMKNTDDATGKTKLEFQEIDKFSAVSETQDKPPKQDAEVPTQQKRDIADHVPMLENLKITEDMQQKDGEHETEPTVKEPARKSLSDLIQKVKVTDKTEVATTEPRIEEEAKAEGEDEDGDEHKDDKTSPDSIVMVETKDTVSIIKTQKKSHGILSGVGSKVKHSISKVKKALTGKSSHTTKPSSPQ